MGQSSEFGQFLRVLRARLRPEAMGLRTASTARRVSGLHHEEIAQLAGVSTDFYDTRLEQDRQIRPSQTVLDAVANGGPGHRCRPDVTDLTDRHEQRQPFARAEPMHQRGLTP